MQPGGKPTDIVVESNGGSMSEDMIAMALEAVRSRIAQHELERIEIDRAIANAKEEERLLQRLLDLRRGARSQIESLKTSEKTVATPPPDATAERRHPAVLAVIDELAQAGRPVHISDLMRLLGQRRIAIPGAGSQANLIAHLRRDARLVRPSRGMYGLAAWGLENMVPGQRRLRKKRFRVTVAKQRTDK